MKGKTNIYFRADGNSQIGLGHVIRSLALVEMLRNSFPCHFIIRNPLPTLKSQILELCESIVELPENDEAEAKKIAEELLTNQDIIVLDGYHFRTEYQRAIKKSKAKLVCIDDIFAHHFLADIIINHAGGVSPAQYSAEAHTQFLLGLKYALLRKPFREASKAKQAAQRNAIFICLGGADPNNDTIQVIQKGIAHTEFETFYVVVGAAYIYRAELEALVNTLSQKIVILQNISAEEMVAYMQKCKVAITSPSTISYEYLSIGGILHLKVTADNQKNINKYFLESGLAFSFDDFPIQQENKVEKALSLQRAYFDGKTQDRFINLFKSLSSAVDLPVD